MSGCAKQPYRSEKTAKRAARHLKGQGYPHARPYRCSAGCKEPTWHITTGVKLK